MYNDTLFHNRSDAGKKLANQLDKYQGNKNAVVLALPRGGIPVAYEVAQKLNLPLDVFLVRKLGVPYHKELAMGAIASGDVVYLNEEIINDLNISQSMIKKVTAEEKIELERRELRYRQGRSLINIKNKIVILIDDGIATGATIHAAINALRKMLPEKIIIAVPVAPESTLNELVPFVEEIICLHSAIMFGGVGMFYADFSQTTDEEVCALINSKN